MNKLNALGNELLEFKKEYNKDYSSIIKKSLDIAIDKMAEDEIIDVDIHYSLKDETSDISNFKLLLLEKAKCLKTVEELLVEYETIRAKLNNVLDISEEDTENSVETLSSVKHEKISITKEFIITEKFIREYFVVESDEDFKELMKRRGFIEKFAIIRLNKILKDFVTQNAICSSNFEILNSNVFYEVDRNIYGIHLLFNIPIDNLETEEAIEDIGLEVKEIVSESEKFFDSKMQI